MKGNAPKRHDERATVSILDARGADGSIWDARGANGDVHRQSLGYRRAHGSRAHRSAESRQGAVARLVCHEGGRQVVGIGDGVRVDDVRVAPADQPVHVLDRIGRCGAVIAINAVLETRFEGSSAILAAAPIPYRCSGPQGQWSPEPRHPAPPRPLRLRKSRLQHSIRRKIELAGTTHSS
jgi:hypothetical protein